MAPDPGMIQCSERRAPPVHNPVSPCQFSFSALSTSTMSTRWIISCGRVKRCRARGIATSRGAKGPNQSVALARAGAHVFHAGRIGPDGLWLRDAIAAEGVDVTHVGLDNQPTGHAIIQVDPAGENSILLYGGANLSVTSDDARYLLSHFGEGDWLLLQNEISALPAILREASERRMTVAFNPAPMTPEVLDYPLEGVSLFIVNGTEGAALAGIEEALPTSIVDRLQGPLSRSRDSSDTWQRGFALCERRGADQNAGASGRGGGYDCGRRHLHRLLSGGVAGRTAGSAGADCGDQGSRAVCQQAGRGGVDPAQGRTGVEAGSGDGGLHARGGTAMFFHRMRPR